MNYEQFKIRRFDLWDLYLHVNQFPYLGRCIASAVRPDANEVAKMTPSEREELFDTILPCWERAVEVFHPKFRTNLAIFGNTTPHLHAHLIPRFDAPRSYSGITFIDPNPTGNYAPYPKKDIALETLLKIKDELKKRV